MGPNSSRAVAAAVCAGLLLAGCGGTSDDGAADPVGTATPTAGAGATPTGSVPAQFLALTAEHLCAVQGQVYPDPAALADAFETPPEYPGVPSERVRSLTRRLETDPGFARDLNERIAATCGTDDSAG